MASNQTQEGTRMMYNPQTKGVGPVPFSQVEQAIKDGLELTTSMVNPETGKSGWIADSLVDQAKNDGLQASGIPIALSPYERQQAEMERQRLKSEETIGDKFSNTFLSGGANDIRNMAAAVTGGASSTVGNALAQIATRSGRAIPVIAKDAKALYDAAAGSGAAKAIGSVAKVGKDKAVSLGKHLAKWATGAGIAKYVYDQGYDAAKGAVGGVVSEITEE